MFASSSSSRADWRTFARAARGNCGPDTSSNESIMNEAPRETTTTIAALLLMTAATGIVDAVSYLGLGHVFTANMTGNVVLLGFAAAGAPGFSIAASLASLGSFLLGAAAGGRVTSHVPSRRRWLLM